MWKRVPSRVKVMVWETVIVTMKEILCLILFHCINKFQSILNLVKPFQRRCADLVNTITINKACIQIIANKYRLFHSGKGKKKLTTAERWKKKKESKTQEEEDQNSVNITKLTELANELLTRTGNMDIYQESYEQIKKKGKNYIYER